jgi:C4-type Zn-finger protein
MKILNAIQKFLDPITYTNVQEFKRELADEAKQLKTDAESSPCPVCKEVKWILIDTTTEELYGWGDIVEGEYKCGNCGYKKTERIENPN